MCVPLQVVMVPRLCLPFVQGSFSAGGHIQGVCINTPRLALFCATTLTRPISHSLTPSPGLSTEVFALQSLSAELHTVCYHL